MCKSTVYFEKFTRPNSQTLVKPPDPTPDDRYVLLTALKQVGLFLGGDNPTLFFIYRISSNKVGDAVTQNNYKSLLFKALLEY
jgi:hypothetical protein